MEPLQEINASDNTDGKIQPLATQAKVPRPAKHDDEYAASRLLRGCKQTIEKHKK
jgi:hypothetical protein